MDFNLTTEQQQIRRWMLESDLLLLLARTTPHDQLM
jgi:hypothetical protein